MTRDLTRQPIRSDALADFGRVAGELVHDLANDMQVLQGWATLAHGEIEQGRIPAGEVERLVRISEALGRMLHDLLSTVAGEGLSPEVVFDPGALTETTLSDRLREVAPAQLHLRASLPAGVRVAGRASFWVRVLINLLRNATRHCRSTVLVSLALDFDESAGEVVVLRVEDDGAGVMPQMRALVFQPFWRGEHGGTGLGLSSVAWSVEQLGGEVRCVDDSSLGGAAFEVRVPCARPVAVKGSAGASPGALEGQRLLLIDDDPAIRFAVARLLRRAGAEVREIDPVEKPDEPLMADILSSMPDVVLMDLHLRERGGLTLWRRLRADMPQLAERVLFISGAAPGDVVWEDAHRTGQPVLAKPFDLRQLVDAVAHFGRPT